MLIEMGQVAAEAAKQGSITFVIPTAFLSSVTTLLLYKGVPFLLNAMRGKTRNGHIKPGDGETCKKHGEKIAGLVSDQENTDVSLKRIESKVDDLPLKLLEIFQRQK